MDNYLEFYKKKKEEEKSYDLVIVIIFEVFSSVKGMAVAKN